MAAFRKSSLFYTAVAALTAAVLTYPVFFYAVLNSYQLIYESFFGASTPVDQLDTVARAVGGWAANAFFVAVAVWLGSWVVRRVGRAPYAHPVAVGLVAAIMLQVLFYFLAGGVQYEEVVAYSLLGFMAGLLGGRLGSRVLTQRAMLHRVSTLLGAAGRPDEIVAIIGENITAPGPARVQIWQNLTGFYELVGSWSARGEGAYQAQIEVHQVESLALNGKARWVHGPSRRIFFSDTRGSLKGTTLLLALHATTEHSGLMVVHFDTWIRPSAVHESDLTALAQTVSLILENLRLTSEVRQASVLAERHRLAREMHRTVGGGAKGVAMMQDAALHEAEKAQPSLDTIRDRLHAARAAAKSVYNDAKWSVWGLRPDVLLDRSLREAVTVLIKEWAGKTRVQTDLRLPPAMPDLSDDAQLAVIEILQEALSNAWVHARARRVVVSLAYTGSLVLQVSDDGVGFSAGRTGLPTDTHVGSANGRGDLQGGFGLRSMQERAASVGGQLMINSDIRRGTTITATLPTSQPSDARHKVVP